MIRKSFVASCALLGALGSHSLSFGQEHTVASLPAAVVKTEPQAGLTDVDPSITEISVTYSKKMRDKTWSWGQISDDTYPKSEKARYLKDHKTCVLPVKLEPGHTYVLELNSLQGKFNNFKDADGRPAIPYLLVFQTKAAASVK